MTYTSAEKHRVSILTTLRSPSPVETLRLTNDAKGEASQDRHGDVGFQPVKHHHATDKKDGSRDQRHQSGTDADSTNSHVCTSGGKEVRGDNERRKSTSVGVRVRVRDVGKHREPQQRICDAEDGARNEGRPVRDVSGRRECEPEQTDWDTPYSDTTSKEV